MNVPARRLAVALACMLLVAGCLVRRPPVEPPGPTAWREWIVTSDSAERLATLGHQDASDSVVADFVRRWPGAPEASEAQWRLLVRSAAQAEDSAATTALLARVDSMLATSPSSDRRAQLLTMKRMVLLTQQLRIERALLRAERDSTRVRTEEVEKLKAELAQTQAELERVRNRVTRRRPGR